ncbi:MAG: hypothetical protein ACYDC3_06790 [Candidatus Binataceae bacterium]
MKKVFTIMAAMFAMAVAAPAFAQMNPGQADSEFSRFLHNHPNEARQLQSNPGLIDDHGWINKHPGLHTYLMNHPHVRDSLRGQGGGMMGEAGRMGGPGMMGGPGGRGDGDYDANHQWHNAQWWQQNNPQQWRQNHPQWAQNHPHWGNDGDYDEHHQWQNAQWWQQHHPEKWQQWHHGDGHPDNQNNDHGQH